MTDVPVTIIEARPRNVASRLWALWQYRAFYTFLFKEITARKIRGTLLGFWWLILRPLIPCATAVIVFTAVFPIDTKDVPYAIFYFAAYTTWTMFRAPLILMPRALNWTSGIMRRTYFPKLLVPLAALGPTLIELLIGLLLFAVIVIYYYVTAGTMYLKFGWTMLWYPICLLFSLMLAVGIGMVVGVLALFVRDVIYSVRYFTQFMMAVTPIFYPITLLHADWRWLLYVGNPLAAVVETSRWSLTGVGEFHPYFLAYSVAAIILIFSLCVGFFLRAETYLADEV